MVGSDGIDRMWVWIGFFANGEGWWVGSFRIFWGEKKEYI